MIIEVTDPVRFINGVPGDSGYRWDVTIDVNKHTLHVLDNCLTEHPLSYFFHKLTGEAVTRLLADKAGRIMWTWMLPELTP